MLPTIVPLFLRAWGWLVASDQCVYVCVRVQCVCSVFEGAASGQCVYLCRGSGSRNNEKTMHSYHRTIGHRHFVSKNRWGGCGKRNHEELAICMFLSIFYPLPSYLIFVIFFTQATLLENKIYTEKRQFFALNL